MLELSRFSGKDLNVLGTLVHIVCDEVRQTGFLESITLLLSPLQQLTKSFGDENRAPVAWTLGSLCPRHLSS